MTKTYKKPQRILNCLIDWDQKQITKDASGKVIIKGYANTADKDRVGDVVLPTAFSKTLKEYMENPVVLFQHNWDKVIGKCIKAEVQEDGLYVECEISTAADVDDVRTKIAEGSLKTFSIGYNELLSDYDEASACNVVKELELLEISVVTIPCNPKAKFTTEVTEKATDEKSIDKKFFSYLSSALKQLTTTSDIDGEFLEEIYDIFSKSKSKTFPLPKKEEEDKGGPGSGRRPGSGSPKDKPSRDRSAIAKPAETDKGTFKVSSGDVKERATYDAGEFSFHVSKVDDNGDVHFSAEDNDGAGNDYDDVMSKDKFAAMLTSEGVTQIMHPGSPIHRSSAN